MKIFYLKKKNMYELASSICSNMPKLKDCVYGSYRGMEWLRWSADEECDDGYIRFEMIRSGYYFSLNKRQYLDSAFKMKDLKRQIFYLDENFNLKK